VPSAAQDGEREKNINARVFLHEERFYDKTKRNQ